MASGSRCRGQESASSGAGADALDTLTNPDLAHLPAAELVVRLNRDERSGSDFADVALVLAVRERRLAEAEDRVRKADEVAADLQATIRALELRLRAADAEALARSKRNSLGSDSGGISGGERAGAHEGDDHQSLASVQPQIGAAKLTGGEIRARDLTASDTIVVPDLLAGEIDATPAEIGENMPRPSPLRRIGAALPAASSMADELAEERAAVEQVVVDAAVRSSHQADKVAQAGVVTTGGFPHDMVSEVVAGKSKQEPAAASASEYKEQQPLKKLKPAGALGVASEDSDSDSQVEEMDEDEAQGWKKLDILKAQVAAWESEYDAADAAQAATLQAAAAVTLTPPVEEVQTVIVAEARERSETTVARLEEQIILPLIHEVPRGPHLTNANLGGKDQKEVEFSAQRKSARLAQKAELNVGKDAVQIAQELLMRKLGELAGEEPNTDDTD